MLLASACGDSAPSAPVDTTSSAPPSTTAAATTVSPTVAPTTTVPVGTTIGVEPGEPGASVLPPLPNRGTVVPSGAETRSPATAPPGAARGVAVFGDSLVLQTWDYVHRIAADRNEPFSGGAFGGTALCDWIPEIERVLTDHDPAYLVLAFAGNNLTPCTLTPGGTRRFGGPLIALYKREAQEVNTAARQVGTKVFVVGPPAMNYSAWNDHASRMRVAMHDLAVRNPGVTYLDANEVLSPGGYVADLQCRPFETEAFGCVNGKIVVRAADGVHLSSPVAGYSAGGWRFANVLMRGIPNAS